MPSADWTAPTATGPVDARVVLPGSKSLTNRYLVLAALGERRLPAARRRSARATPCSWPRPCAPWAPRSTTSTTATGSSPPAPLRRRGDGRLRPRRHRHALRAAGGRRWPTAPSRFDGDPHARLRPMGPVLGALRALGRRRRRRRPRRPAVHRARARVGARRAGHHRRLGVLAVRLRAAAGRRPLRRGRRPCATTGKPVPSLPHIEMTVETLRDAGVVVDDGDARHLAGRARARSTPLDVQVEPDLSNAAPFLAAALVTGGRVHVPGLAAVHDPGRRLRCATSST